MIICNHFKHSPVYRVGGDEFVILLQGSDYEDRAELMRTINEKIEGNVGTPNAVIALGCAEYQPDDRSFHAVFERADGAMYRGKKELKSMGAVIRDL